METKITQKDGFVEINFSNEMSNEAIKKQVNECIGDTCECCTPAFRKKVNSFEYSTKELSTVKIYGTVSKDEVMQNVLSCAPKIKNQ